MSYDIATRLRRGEIVQVGSKLYAICATCDTIVCINKRLLGSLHLCKVDQ